MNENIFTILTIWSIGGAIPYFILSDEDFSRSWNIPQKIYIGVLLGPLVFLITIGRFIFDFLGKTGKK